MSILEMRHISKAFGGSKALNDVHLTVEEGEVHALLGENGAGKSTLMNILTGVIEADQGTITWQGKLYPNPTIAEMEDAGIAFVHQELSVINDLSITDNLFICHEIKNKFGYIDTAKETQKAKELFESLGVELDPNMMVSELKSAEKQLLEICRALHKDAKLIILDEPTTALSNDEIEHLFSIVNNLKAQGKSFIFISHKMPEIFELCDRYTVFRNGEYISSGNIKDTTPHAVTSDMVGKLYVDEEVYKPREIGETVLEVRNLKGKGFRNINFELRKGEIIAFTGLAGCGASEVMQTMFGSLNSDGGQIYVNGKRVVKDGVINGMRSGIAMLPANRKENSVIGTMSIMENFNIANQALTTYSKPIINMKEEEERYYGRKEQLKIKATDYNDGIGSLSGGNQQKVFLARWLNIGASVMLFDNPTQGVDVGAKEEIYKLILDFAENGKAVIINTLEIPEIKKVADRCLVFYDGEIKKEFQHDEVNETDVMLYSTNAIETEGGAQ